MRTRLCEIKFVAHLDAQCVFGQLIPVRHCFANNIPSYAPKASGMNTIMISLSPWHQGSRVKVVLLVVLASLVSNFAYADIQPKNGRWEVSSSLTSETGCPEAFLSFMAARETIDIVFGTPFDASVFGTEGFTWSHLSKNTWRGFFITVQYVDDGTISAENHVDLEVVSSSRITRRSEFWMELPLSAAGKIGENTSISCHAVWTIETTLQGG